VVVPVTVVGGVTVPVVDVVDVVLVGHGDVAAALPVDVVMIRMLGVILGRALVEMPIVSGMQMTVVDIIDVIAVGDGDVATTVAVNVGVVGMFEVSVRHRCSSWECRMASLTMWPTWASASW
jgi:hypothetical protein